MNDPRPDASEPGFHPLGVLARRWPLLVVGIAIGAAIAALVHLTAIPAYQSSAQVLVVKKRTDVVQAGGGDVRVGVVEDHVSTQVTLIKSEKIRKAAAIELRKQKLNRPLPDNDPDNRAAAESLRAGLAVSRDKDTSSPNQVGSGILLLSYRGSDPADARAVLEAIVKAYQQELYAIYDQATLERVATLDRTLDVIRTQRQKSDEEKFKYRDELRKITTEDVLAIRTRVTSLKDRQYALQLDRTDVAEQLKLMESAGKNQTSRRAVFAQLTAQTRLGMAGEVANGPEHTIRILEAQRAELSTELGKDHARVKSIESQIAFLKGEIRRQNPDVAAGTLDELGAYEQRILQRKRTIDLQLKQIDVRLVDDEMKLQDAGGIQNHIDALTDRVQQFDRDISRLDAEKLTTQATQTSGGYTAQTITTPADGGRISPVLFYSILVGLAAGLVLGAAAIVLAEVTDRSFHSPAEIRRRLGLPVLGHIPTIRTDSPRNADAAAGLDPVLVCAVRPKSVEAEAYRGIRTQLYFSTQGKGHTVIQVTSPSPGDGKSTLAANLAISIAHSGKRAILVDCDLRKPRVHKLFDLPNAEIGLVGVIAGTGTANHAIQRTLVPNLDVLPSGPRPENPAELLTSPALPRLLAELRATYDFVIVDTPPLLAVSDPAAIAPRVDGVILVFKMTKSTRPDAERARDQLAVLGANCLGVVVNGYAEGSRGYGSYSYGAGGGYRYSEYQYADQYLSVGKLDAERTS